MMGRKSALIKYNTTDTAKCSDSGASYINEMNLAGCKEDDFTCDDGQCVKLEKRCDQLPNCRDRSDEIGCKFLILDFGYNKRVPPITFSNVARNSITPVNVKVDIDPSQSGVHKGRGSRYRIAV